MLRLHVVHVGRHAYYVAGQQLGDARGMEGPGEAPGAWAGPGATALGLSGLVDPEVFGRVMDGFDPASGRRLRAARGPAGVAGIDLTFCAPKSVSVLEALAPREIRGAVAAGHDAAVEEARAYLSRNAVGVRRRDGGSVRLLASTGMVAGDFRHRTSRALDPHLHTHVVAANLAEGTDGVWSAMDSRRVFAHARTAGSIYQARLRYELSGRIGAAWQVRPSGLGDVVGVDAGLRRLFSQRSAAIDEYVAVRHRGDGRRHPGAFFATRPEKDRTQSMESLVSSWRARAGDFGFDLGELSRVVGRGPRSRGDDPCSFDPRRMAARLEEGGRLDATVARRDLVGLVASASLAGATAQDLDSTVDRIIAAVGPSATGDDAREPRWRRGAVLSVTREQGKDLSVGSVREIPGPTATGRGPGRALDGDRVIAHLRDRQRDRGDDRGHDRQRDRQRDRGPGLGL